MKKQTDIQLVALARRGDREAFGHLIERYYGMSLRIALKMVSNKEIARELVQEALLQMYLSLNTLREDKAFKNWLYGIVLNVCRNHIRSRNTGAPGTLDGHILIDPDPSPEKIVEAQELHQKVLDAIEKLSPKVREATLLFYYKEMNLQEVATTMGVAVGTVKAQLYKARENLRQELRPVYVEMKPDLNKTGRATVSTLQEAAKKNVTIHKDISKEVKAPVLLAGWPGMGNVGLNAINYIREKLDATLFVEIDISEYFASQKLLVENSLVQFEDVPSYAFYYVQNPELVIFEGERQVTEAGGIALLNQILDIAEALNVQAIYTGASYLQKGSYKDLPRVFGVANQKAFRDSMFAHKADNLEEGVITGLNGLLLGYAQLRGIAAGCLLGTIPHYAGQSSNPKASKEIISVLEGLLGFELDKTELNQKIEKMDKILAEIELKAAESD